METIERITPILGRILLSVIFLVSGYGKITDWSGSVGYMAAKGMPFVSFFLAAAILIEILGGLTLLTGYMARWGGLVLFLYMIPVTLIFHNFWAYQGPERQMQQINFMKNLAILGGLLMVFAYGSGAHLSRLSQSVHSNVVSNK